VIVGRGGRRLDLALLAGLALLVVAVPLVASTQLVTLGVFAGFYAIGALGLSLLMGRAGQVSLGQAGFLAVGAYTSAILVVRHGWNALAAAAVAVVVTALLGLVVGLPLLRLRGHYLALATLGFGIIVAVVANEWEFTGATSGIYGIPKPAFNGRTYDSAREFFWLVWPLVLVATWLAANLVRGRVGRALAAVSDSEVAAQTLGVDTFRLRLQVLVLSAALASVAGSMYAHWVTVVNPSAASFLLSVELLLMAVVGGLSSVWGAVLGAVFVQALGELLTIWVPRLIPGASGEYQLIGFGVVLAAVVVLLPGGLVAVVRRLAGAGRPAAATMAPAPRSRVDGAATAGGPLLARDGRPAPGTAVLRVTGVSRRFGGVRAVDGVDLVVATGEVVALIGPNGAGKSTLFDVISGVIQASAGTVAVADTRVAGRPHQVAAARAARTFQNLEIFGSMTALENVMVGRHLRSRAGMLAAAVVLPARAEEAAIEASARGLLDLLGLAEVADAPAGELPFGRQRLVEIARALATEPDLLLLDEPMAGLSAAERAGLVRLLRRLRDGGMAILLVEHDVDAVMALADRVVVLDEGRVIGEGPPAAIRKDPAVISAYLGDEISPEVPPVASRKGAP
jgi:branched-chain amino acid transport system permease protein